MLLHDFADGSSAVNDVIMAFDYFLKGRRINYVATPITTGQRYIKWYQYDGYKYITATEFKTEHIKNVIDPNCQDALKYTRQLQSQQFSGNPTIIYCPAELPFPFWSHADCLRLCHHIIKNYAIIMTLLPGWETSFGCVQEYYLAQQLGLACYTHNKIFIDSTQAIESISQTIPQMLAANLPIDGMLSYLDKLKSLSKVTA
jgi:Domain of unknown function (DUF4406)